MSSHCYTSLEKIKYSSKTLIYHFLTVTVRNYTFAFIQGIHVNIVCKMIKTNFKI